MSDTGAWKIGYRDGKHKKDIEEEYKSDTRLEKRWDDFERDVKMGKKENDGKIGGGDKQNREEN